MVWDLRGALLKKQEAETARLIDFEFKLRARTMRRLAKALNLPPDELVQQIALKDDAAILDDVARTAGLPRPDVQHRFERCATKARAELIREHGDPSPHRLA